MIHIGKKRYIAFLSGRKNIEGVPPYGEIPYFAFPQRSFSGYPALSIWLGIV